MSEEKFIILNKIKVIKDFYLMNFVFVWIFVVDLLVCVCILFERLVIKKKREREKRKLCCFLFYFDICFVIVLYLCEKFCIRMFI